MCLVYGSFGNFFFHSITPRTDRFGYICLISVSDNFFYRRMINGNIFINYFTRFTFAVFVGIYLIGVNDLGRKKKFDSQVNASGIDSY